MESALVDRVVVRTGLADLVRLWLVPAVDKVVLPVSPLAEPRVVSCRNRTALSVPDPSDFARLRLV